MQRVGFVQNATMKVYLHKIEIFFNLLISLNDKEQLHFRDLANKHIETASFLRLGEHVSYCECKLHQLYFQLVGKQWKQKMCEACRSLMNKAPWDY